jgi:hypothetical protein
MNLFELSGWTRWIVEPDHRRAGVEICAPFGEDRSPPGSSR